MPRFLFNKIKTANSPEVLRSADVRNVLVSELKLKYKVVHDRMIVPSKAKVLVDSVRRLDVRQSRSGF